ncbi:hypothetical protein ES707_14883 [subsurface metagenome]
MSWRGFARALENIPIGNCVICGESYSSRTSVTVAGKNICSNCYRKMKNVVNSRIKKINGALDEIEKSISLKNNLKNYSKLVESAKELLIYEKKGFDIFKNFTPSQIIAEYEGKKEQIMLDGIRADIDEALKKSKIAATQSAKITPFNKILMLIEEYKDEIKDKAKLKELELRAKELKYETQVDMFVEDAKKAEFKGDKNKALDKYMEALYLLKNMEISNLKFVTKEKEIEEKILKLK